jgi:hypothetical protein
MAPGEVKIELAVFKNFLEPGRRQEVGQFRCLGNGLHSWALSPDGRVFAVCAKEATVPLVDARKVVAKQTLPGAGLKSQIQRNRGCHAACIFSGR